MANSRVCLIPDCGKQVKSRGLCNAHLHRLRRFGESGVDVPVPPAGTALNCGKSTIFLKEVAFSYTGADCLDWPYGKTREGYGKAAYNGRYRGAHLIVCEVVHGRKPAPNYEAAHACGNASCVNPQHIRWATPKENTSDKIAHGTIQRGENHPSAKLTRAAVDDILATRGIKTYAELAAEYGVSRSTICMIRSGYHWNS